MNPNQYKWWLLILGLILGANALAQTSDLKIGFIDMDRIRKESAPADRAFKKLKKEFDPRGQELDRMGQQIKALQTQLEKEGLTMSEGDRRAKEQELARLNRDLQRSQREFQEDLNLRQNEEYGALIEQTSKVVKQITDTEKYDLILQDAVYHSPRIDITDKVLKALATDKQ
ncbi:MAG TPA: OmpH family outer membrane protein [Burkholderiales bacterium]|nr:OmpH family outer membrane protein [Burkholderiales bacterium]